MSPEQTGLADHDVDTRTDIYSLGVLLYELLIGTVPFESAALRRAGYAEMQRIIREDEPRRPSTRLRASATAATAAATSRRSTLPRLIRQIRGDLDWIALKALEKNPAERYQSASELAIDIRRYLDDEPVIARPPSFAYRSRKFVRKHRKAAAVAGVLLLVLTAGLVASTTMYIHAELSREEADEQRRLHALQRSVAETAAGDARNQRDNAEAQRQLADRQRAAAEAAGREAERQRTVAQYQERQASAERRAAERQRDEAFHLSYRSALLAADLSVRQGTFVMRSDSWKRRQPRFVAGNGPTCAS